VLNPPDTTPVFDALAQEVSWISRQANAVETTGGIGRRGVVNTAAPLVMGTVCSTCHVNKLVEPITVAVAERAVIPNWTLPSGSLITEWASMMTGPTARNVAVTLR